MNNIKSYQDIERLIEFKEAESHRLAYGKVADLDLNSPKKIENFSILISSIANANGGYILYGIDSNRKKAKSITPIDSNLVNRDQIIYAIESAVSPEIEDLEVYSIATPDDESKCIFCIKISNSANAPHMASDNRFYKRIDNKAHLMHEYEIREMYHRSKKPDIDLFGILNTSGIPTLMQGKFELVNFYPRFLVKNTSSVIEKDYKIEIFIPSALHNPNFDILQKHFSRMEDDYSVFAVTNESPLYQNELATVVEGNLFVNAENYKYFEGMDIIVKLYFSNGVKTKYYSIKETFLYRNASIQQSDFVSTLVIE